MRAWIAAFFARRREFRERVAREATDLMNWMGEMAYAGARQRAREARGRQDDADARLWAKVAVEIARRTGQDIGIKGADRYPDPGPRPKEPTRNRREIAERLVDISRGIAALSAGRGDVATLHNIDVAARQVLDFTGRTYAIEKAVLDVIGACQRVQAYPTIDDLLNGRYPPVVDEAALALQKLRRLALP
ncbi:hypothetical protein [Enterovirga rhinocerotis]|uniref:Uncharacterized protein n=1 Tax=Enterovirga rhinocerotis TaxID=1339210 RepID=A0A4V3DXP4_9HYPH|nr:hypothetical protein [Enterovirga rhinocerotis]TDR89539.1 hypothetical protein EV668_2369 [Enterovirga rhinocerotis]